MESTRRLSIAAVIVPSVIVIGLLGIGFIAGRYTVIRTFDKQIRGFSKSASLGHILANEQQRRTIASAYYDSDAIMKVLDNISFAVPNIPSPFVGTAPMPGWHGVAHINAMQFRADKEVQMPKPPHTYRIFITGGSTAYGTGAPSDDRTIAGYLEKILSQRLSPVTSLNYEVFTMANPGWASTHERIMIENVLSELEPDMIIAVSGVNDVQWGKFGRNVFWFRSYADEYFLGLIKDVYAYAKQPKIPEITHIDESPIPPRTVAERLLKNVKLSLFALSERNVDYVFARQPTRVLSEGLTTASTPPPDYMRECYALYDTLLKTLHSKRFLYVDLSGVFDNFKGQTIYIDAYHVGDKGNQIIAENIYQHIKERVTKQTR